MLTKNCAISARLWLLHNCYMSSGIFGSAQSQADATACEQCGSKSRVGRGLCLNCMLQRGLSEIERKKTLEAVLDEIDVRDAEWRIGNYQILEEIGRGGMGVIYRARQRHSRRIVALKRVLSYQADSHETLARFRREAEAAASLDHPNILPIHEVSESEDGLPFFSMKFAAGGSLLDAAPPLQREPRRGVALMAKVARAVHYAHSHAILHRDLKPGNILLDGCGEPLVSDFGLAKWLDTSTDLTRSLTIFGTPGYIAPEQAKKSAANLTPAADVYSLGAILFDLFTGRPPFLGEHALAVIEQAAEKPAPKLRSIAPPADRDLETICARCLEREPAARYQSAAALADDLECWLEGKPIKARRVLPPTRVWRWSRRNPRLVATAAACLFLGGASIWFLWQEGWMQQISIATKKLFLSPKQAAEQSKLQQALVEYPNVDVELKYSHTGNTDTLASTPERLYSMLGERLASDPRFLRDKLPKFAEAVKRNPDAPRYERACAVYLGKDFAESERLSLMAADEAQKAGPAATTDVIGALKLAALSACRTSEFTRAREHLGEAERLIDQSRDPQQWADVQWAIATVLLNKSDTHGEAEKTVRRVIEVRTHIFGPENRETLSARRLLGLCLLQQAKCPEAEVEYRDLIRLDEKILGPEHPETIWSHWDLVTVLSGDFGYADPEACLAEIRHVLKLREKVLGPEHPDTLNARGGVAAMLDHLGRYREAIAQMRELLVLERKVLGPDDSTTVLTLYNLGANLAQVGEFREAETTLRAVIPWYEKTRGADAYRTLYCRGILAVILAAQNKALEAEAEAREIMKFSDRSAENDRAGATRDYLGIVLDKQGRYPEAEAQLREALRMDEKSISPTGRDARNCRGHLAKTLWYEGKNTEAESVLRELIALHEKALAEKVYSSGENMFDRGRLSEEGSDLTPLTSRTLLANTLRDQGKYAEAEAQYKDLIQLEEKVLGPDQRDTLNTYYNYAYQLAEQGNRDAAKTLAERAAKGAAKVLPLNDPDTQEYAKFLEILEKDQSITVPYMKFHEPFWLGKQT
jgi:serine/threonine protein kinase